MPAEEQGQRRGRRRARPGQDAGSVGRTNPYPYAQIPLWVLLGPLSDGAIRLYAVLVAHVNERRGDNAVWPERETLAKELGKSPRSVTRLVTELADFGAIDVHERKNRGSLTGLVFWEPSTGPDEYRARFVRDPLGLTTGVDSTATTDDVPTPGGQYRPYHHEMFVTPGTPIGLMVRHDGPVPVGVTLAEFKLAIHLDAS